MRKSLHSPSGNTQCRVLEFTFRYRDLVILSLSTEEHKIIIYSCKNDTPGPNDGIAPV